ncbi:11819_t:CDS:2 [Ambispora leptoticha]|uniref:11819_t:CDS:1 n=1 Tax=Ambispora leptoticha TaxID=144679 RepID=A0A9N9B8G3_9GLOM|nr:11819_t:CDS:2 [Ambispora leptoticha]
MPQIKQKIPKTRHKSIDNWQSSSSSREEAWERLHKKNVTIIYNGNAAMEELIERFENPTNSKNFVKEDELHQLSLDGKSKSNSNDEEAKSAENFRDVKKWISELPATGDFQISR